MQTPALSSGAPGAAVPAAGTVQGPPGPGFAAAYGAARPADRIGEEGESPAAASPERTAAGHAPEPPAIAEEEVAAPGEGANTPSPEVGLAAMPPPGERAPASGKGGAGMPAASGPEPAAPAGAGGSAAPAGGVGLAAPADATPGAGDPAASVPGAPPGPGAAPAGPAPAGVPDGPHATAGPPAETAAGADAPSEPPRKPNAHPGIGAKGDGARGALPGAVLDLTGGKATPQGWDGASPAGGAGRWGGATTATARGAGAAEAGQAGAATLHETTPRAPGKSPTIADAPPPPATPLHPPAAGRAPALVAAAGSRGVPAPQSTAHGKEGPLPTAPVPGSTRGNTMPIRTDSAMHHAALSSGAGATAAAPGETGLPVPRQMAPGNLPHTGEPGEGRSGPGGAAAAGQTTAANMPAPPAPVSGVGGAGLSAPAHMAPGSPPASFPGPDPAGFPRVPDGQPAAAKDPAARDGTFAESPARTSGSAQVAANTQGPRNTLNVASTLPDGGVGPAREGPPGGVAGASDPALPKRQGTARAAVAVVPYGGAARLPAAAAAADRLPYTEAGREALRGEPGPLAGADAMPAGLADAEVRIVPEREGVARAEAPPRTPAAQLAGALAAAPGGRAEILLDPEELGRVRLTLVTSPEGVSVAVLAERPETLDLLRRGADGLAEEFRALGFRDIGFSFGQAGTGHREPGGGEAAPLPGAPAPPPGEGAAAAPDAPPRSRPGAGATLDLRW